MTHQPFWVILCGLPEKGRNKIEEIVAERKETDREERGKMKESEETEEQHPPPLPFPAARTAGLAQL